MKYIFLVLLFISSIYGSLVKSPIVSVDDLEATIVIEKIDVGMSGFIVHQLDEKHSSILKKIVVTSYDKESKVATLKMSDYDLVNNPALPKGKWEVKVGDIAVLAFGYSRALLVSPSENIYSKITKSTQGIEWIHPDIFATMLSFNGHPTPLKSDFNEMCNVTSVGILFFYLDKKVFTLDCQSLKILNISEAILQEKKSKLPFYSRVADIDANWWGEGSDELKEFTPHYYELMVKNNKNNKNLFDIISNNEKTDNLVKYFEIKE